MALAYGCEVVTDVACCLLTGMSVGTREGGRVFVHPILIIQDVAERNAVILGPLSSEVTYKTKEMAWRAVTETVDSFSRALKEVPEVKTDKKIKDALVSNQKQGSQGKARKINHHMHLLKTVVLR